MSRNVLLIGGGEMSKGETGEIDGLIMRLAPRGSKLVFFGTAANDSEGYAQVVRDVFGAHFDVIAAGTAQGRDFSEQAIREASAVYLGGGATELLMSHFDAWKLVPLIADAIGRGAVVAGMSAGAQALSHSYIHEEAGSMEVRRGWGLLDARSCVLVHATAESFETAAGLFAATPDGETEGLYGIGERAALWFRDDGVEPEKVGEGSVYAVA